MRSLALSLVLFAIFGCSNGTGAATAAPSSSSTAGDTASDKTSATPVAGSDSANASGSVPAETNLKKSSTATARQEGSMPTSAPAPEKYDGPATTNENVSAPPRAGDDVAVIDTKYGKIVFKFFPDKAPVTVANFKALARAHFYDGTKFHRVVPGFMIQGGDPNTKSGDRSTWGSGGPGYSIPGEFSDIHHVRGIVSTARTQDPNSGGSQFFIVVKDSTFLDGQYAAFGYVVKGMDAADKIVNLPNDGPPGNTISEGQEKNAEVNSIRIEKWPVK